MQSLWHTVLMKRHARLPIGFISRAGRRPAVRLAFACALCLSWSASASTCYGSSANGRLDGGVQLPASGTNFVAYSAEGVGLGRTYVHDVVRKIVVDAYTHLAQTMPEKTFVYGETGLEHGGTIPPHKTHQAGISVDFMVPVLDRENRSVPLPATRSNKFGYGLEFDGDGRIPGYRIDFDAMAEHLFQLSLASRQHGIAIKRVIFDRGLLEKLFNTKPHGAELKRTIPFMKGEPWIRHDEHYHVDFDLACRPLSELSPDP
jgi:penicillin-insensitive murein endopeptidase